MCNPALFLMTIVASVLAEVVRAGQRQPPGPRAFFVFGDSLVDYGNNNYIESFARADRLPYGIDYPNQVPTGRFSNGLNIADIVAEELGLEPVLAYLDPDLNGTKLFAGANFASAGVGILNDTGSQFVAIIRMYEQLQYFEDYQARVCKMIGTEKAQQLVSQGLSLIVLGGNDFINNYFYRPVWFIPLSVTMLQYSIPKFVKILIPEYRKILMRLYELGARRVLVTGTGPLGCAPGEKASGSLFGECALLPQEAAALFNPQLRNMLQGLNQQVGSQVFVFVNTIDMHNDFINHPKAYGFATSMSACCGQGPYNGVGYCGNQSNLCDKRDEFVFWDAFHPTEKANRLIVKNMLNGTTQYMDPMNLNTIMATD